MVKEYKLINTYHVRWWKLLKKKSIKCSGLGVAFHWEFRKTWKQGDIWIETSRFMGTYAVIWGSVPCRKRASAKPWGRYFRYICKTQSGHSVMRRRSKRDYERPYCQKLLRNEVASLPLKLQDTSNPLSICSWPSLILLLSNLWVEWIPFLFTCTD